ncbi:MAG: DUF5692 family protein [Actinomyces sp.]|nr:DUF5692 family protein [Actinomyces sp.]
MTPAENNLNVSLSAYFTKGVGELFLFESIPWYSWLAWFGVLAALIIGNEITRRWKWQELQYLSFFPLF